MVKLQIKKLFNPVLEVLHKIGKEATVYEIKEEVIKLLNLPQSEIDDVLNNSRNRLDYNLTWVRNYLKRFGLIQNTERGKWSLTSKGVVTTTLENDDIKKIMKLKQKIRI